MALAAGLVCAASLALLLWGEWAGADRVRRAAKLVASGAFVLAALGGGALETTPGSWLAAGLVCGALGDAALLGAGRRALATGMALFGLGHLCYLAACAQLVAPAGWRWPLLAIPGVLGFLALRSLWPHLGRLRAAVTGYAALLCLTATAAWMPLLSGAAPRPAAAMLAAGASAFFVSDLAVARQRFVARRFANKAWGLPLYYGGQLLIALAAARLVPGAQV